MTIRLIMANKRFIAVSTSCSNDGQTLSISAAGVKRISKSMDSVSGIRRFSGFEKIHPTKAFLNELTMVLGLVKTLGFAE